ncbi:MAG: cyclase family protein [Myxococcota bacterium]
MRSELWGAIGALIWGATLTLGCGGGAPTTRLAAQGEPRELPRSCRPWLWETVDLSHPLRAEMTAGAEASFLKEVSRDFQAPGARRTHRLTLTEDIGTHIDAPHHASVQGVTLDRIPPSRWVAPVVLIDVRGRVKDDPDFVIEGREIVDWEAINGKLPLESVVVFLTGWQARFQDPALYLGRDAQGILHHPGLSPAAAEYLRDSEVKAVGIDTANLDPGMRSERPAEAVLLGAGRYVIESLTQLDRLPETGATIVVGTLPVVDGAGSPARVLALVPPSAREKEEAEP